MKRYFSRVKWRDVVTFLFFFIFAAVIWFGHAMQSVRNTRVPVLIHYSGKPDNIGLGSEGLPDTVMVEVRDAGQRLNAYWREPLHLTIDLRSYIHGDRGTIHVTSDALRRSISDILQGTSRLIETTPESITCTYFTEQEKSFPLAFSGTIRLVDEYQLTGRPVLSRKRVKLFGQEKQLAATDTVRTLFTEWNDVCDTAVIRVALDIPKGMRAEFDSVDVTATAERFTEKKFILPIHVNGVPEGYHIRLFPNEAEVRVRVGISHFNQVNSQDIRAVCAYTPESKDRMEINLNYTNRYITAAWVYPSVIEFILEQ